MREGEAAGASVSRLTTMLEDGSWADRSVPLPLQIALVSFGILVLELALIRWTSSQVRLFAYFNNLVLMATFLGMGLGVKMGRRLPGLVHLAMPLLLLVSVPLAFSEPLGLVHLRFPDSAVHLWGAEARSQDFTLLFNVALIVALFWAVTVVFACVSAALGHLVARMGTLRAYSWDLVGSLFGVLAMTAVTATSAPPPAWFALGCLPLSWLFRKPLTIACGVGVVVLAGFSIQGAFFSPYNRIDVARAPGSPDFVISVNRDFHQTAHDLSQARIEAMSPGTEGRDVAEYRRMAYDIPFTITRQRGPCLVVGAGSGNDVQAALRNRMQAVYAVDIDPVIVRLGRQLHPERPYDDPRVIPVVDDARAFLERHREPKFDVICYGLLDSHAMFSSMSTLRLDNYVYTEQGLRAAYNLLSPKGVMSVSFSVYAGPWISDRMFWTIERATGVRPIIIDHGMHHGQTYLVARDASVLDLSSLRFRTLSHGQSREFVQTTSDDWPFLYIRPGVFPWGYVTLLALVLLTAAVATRVVFGARMWRHDFDAPLFFMGAAFLLIETRGVTDLSLLFGSTWMVNASVFSGILVMVLVANVLVERSRVTNPVPWFLPLCASLLLLWSLPTGLFNQYPLVVRGVLGGLCNGLPVAFAGVIVSILLARSRNLSASLGSNLLGSVVGGCLEYLSMWCGLKALLVGAALLYGLALFGLVLQGSREAPAGEGAEVA